MRIKLFNEPEFGLLAILAAGAGRQVHRNDRQFAEVGFDVTAFVVKFAHAKAGDNLSGFHPAIQADAAVALFLRIMKVPVVARWGQHLRRHVRRLRLEFLHAQHVRLMPGQPRQKALAFGRADTIQIQGNNA